MTRAAPDADASRPPSLMVGVDLGGTKIEAAALDATGRVQARRRIASPRGDYDATIRALAGLIAAVEDEAGAHGTIGIAIPGSISPRTGLIQNANSVWLNGRPLHADLETALDRPVRLANDANCFAISEAVDGAAAGARIVFGVIIGTGCGGGIVIDGRVVDGPRGIGGEWGHNPLPWTDATEHPGPQCWCGRRGCMETWVSGTGMAADHAQITGERATAEEVAERAAHGDEQARATLDRHASRLARGLAQMVNVLDPDVIVLGGGLSKLAHLYAQLPGRMAPWIFADNATVDVRPPRWGDASGVRGAAWLWR
jgi:fructokinase